MRVFIALELPANIKKEIGQIQEQLKKAGVKARWVKPEITHLTLVFLGSIAPNKVNTIDNILDGATALVKPITLKLYLLGCFPSPQKPRIVFVALQGELGKLNALAIKIRKGLRKEKICFDEKPFSAHITLGRIRTRKDSPKIPSEYLGGRGTKIGIQDFAKVIKEIKTERIGFIANEITLQKSTITNSGPVYQPLVQFRLSPYVSTQ